MVAKVDIQHITQQDNFGGNQKHEAKNQIELWTKDNRYFRIKFAANLPECNTCIELAKNIEKMAFVDYIGNMSINLFERSFPYRFKIEITNRNFTNYKNGWESYVDISKEIRR